MEINTSIELNLSLQLLICFHFHFVDLCVGFSEVVLELGIIIDGKRMDEVLPGLSHSLGVIGRSASSLDALEMVLI